MLVTLQRKNFVDIYYCNIEAGIANEVDSAVFLQRFCLSMIDVLFRTIVLNNHSTDKLGFFSSVSININLLKH